MSQGLTKNVIYCRAAATATPSREPHPGAGGAPQDTEPATPSREPHPGAGGAPQDVDPEILPGEGVSPREYQDLQDKDKSHGTSQSRQ